MFGEIRVDLHAVGKAFAADSGRRVRAVLAQTVSGRVAAGQQCGILNVSRQKAFAVANHDPCVARGSHCFYFVIEKYDPVDFGDGDGTGNVHHFGRAAGIGGRKVAYE